jgi:predicted  nucleic acid-binding Zn-ribbon protein
MVEILAYLSATFVLGLALGWALWKFGVSKEMKTLSSEKDFWQERLDQARFERDQDQQKIDALEKERASLKKQLRAA